MTPLNSGRLGTLFCDVVLASQRLPLAPTALLGASMGVRYLVYTGGAWLAVFWIFLSEAGGPLNFQI